MFLDGMHLDAVVGPQECGETIARPKYDGWTVLDA
jgi:hypothetical protein